MSRTTHASKPRMIHLVFRLRYVVGVVDASRRRLIDALPLEIGLDVLHDAPCRT